MAPINQTFTLVALTALWQPPGSILWDVSSEDAAGDLTRQEAATKKLEKALIGLVASGLAEEQKPSTTLGPMAKSQYRATPAGLTERYRLLSLVK